MAKLPIDLRDQLVQHLRQASAHTEEVFVRLGRTLPHMIEEMHLSITSSQRHLAAFCGSTGCNDQTDQNSLTRHMRLVTEASAAEFQRLYEQNNAVFGRLREGIDRLSEITESIEHIKMDSEDMELVSLNAMTVALKAGVAGRAFSYITEELKRLATRTITLTNSIENRGSALFDAFSQLRGALEEAQAAQQSLFDGFRSRIGSSFTDMERAAATILEGMQALQSRSRELERPMYRIMESIQLQDIIRQSIDHIILALLAIEDPHTIHEEEAWRDELVFIQRIPALVATLLEDVVGQIERSVRLFIDLIRDADVELSALERDRLTLLSGGRAGNEVQRNIAEARGLFAELLNDLRHGVAQKEQLSDRSNAIISEVNNLESDFRIFTSLVTRFHSIDIASRIEVAKQSVLQRMGSTVQQMTSLTDKIEQDVERSLDVTQRFIQTTTRAIDTLRAQHERERAFVETFGDQIRVQYDGIERLESEIGTLVGGFSLFTGQFVTLFRKTADDLAELQRRCAVLGDLTADVQLLEQKIMKVIHEDYPEIVGKVTQISDQRLRTIIDRFTIFDHKQRASSAAGIELSASAEAGDITLF